MDDIRNTSALFVGGQDIAPHTERTARELWQLLFQKTENEMAGYMNRLDQLSRDELIQAADEISAMMTCHSELMTFGENLSRKKMIFLLQQEKPLELLSEAWMEHQTVDVGETFQSLLTGLYDETRQTQVRDMVYSTTGSRRTDGFSNRADVDLYTTERQTGAAGGGSRPAASGGQQQKGLRLSAAPCQAHRG